MLRAPCRLDMIFEVTKFGNDVCVETQASPVHMVDTVCIAEESEQPKPEVALYRLSLLSVTIALMMY